MKKIVKFSVIVALTFAFVFGLTGPISAYAATTPNLGVADTFGVLSSTYTNTLAGTINGDLGYTTPPATATTVNGTKYVAPDGTYTQAGTDQGNALTNLNSQLATYSFPAGAIDLASDTTRGGTTGEYTPGVYSIIGAGSIDGGGTITLNGAGTYIFRMTGALNTTAGSKVVLTGGASACDVFWTPVATTLGANSTFVGTVIDNSGITVGSTATWMGRALDYATTVTTNNDTITVPTTCAAEAAAREAATAAAAAKAAADAAAAAAAKFPNTGIAQYQNSILWVIVVFNAITTISILLYLGRRKQTN